MRWWRVAGAAALALVVAGCGAMRGTPEPPPAGGSQDGVASWYGPGFHGRRTASGEVFDQRELTAAHPTLPLGTRALVTNLSNGRSVEVRVNDRGPFVGGRVIDLSYAAARAIDMVGPGTARVHIDVLGARPAPLAARAETAAVRVDAPVPVPFELPRARFVVQVAAFTRVDVALHLRGVIASYFPDAYVESIDAGDRTYHRVRIGPYPMRQVAVARAELVSRLGYPAIIMEAEQ